MKPFLFKSLVFLQKNVRKGFLLAVIFGTSVVGSSLYATIAMMPYFQVRFPESSLASTLTSTISARAGVPTELAWFFVQYAYLSSDVNIRPKNRHTFIISDTPRGREYVVTVGQSFRRVEIYFRGEKDRSTVHVFTPGRKRVVDLRDAFVVSDDTRNDPNLWMWQSPLWNSQHIKIYALADFWLDSPYKKFSCAGFVHRFLGDAGIRVPILDAWDLAKQPWTRVPSDEMEPGDIITIRAASESHRRFWKHRITHVGVYLGNGKLIHASTASHKAKRSYIRVATLDQFKNRIDKVLRPPDLL
jgi:cell wall-associated NlpC family hydrolase